MRAKLDTKKGLYFTHQNGPIFRAKTNLSDLSGSIRLNPRASMQDEANPMGHICITDHGKREVKIAGYT